MKKISFLMLFALSFLVLNCRTEEFHNEEVNQSNSQPRLTSKRISLNESKHKARLLTEIDKAETALKSLSKTNIQGKVISYNNGVLIDTDEVLYIENGPNYYTYTFNLIRENALPTDPVENLVLSPLSDGTYKELLVSYNLSVQEKEILKSGGFVNTKGKTQVTELAQGTFNTNNQLARQVCTTSSYSYWEACSGKQHHDGSNYESCPIYQGKEEGTPPIFYTIITTTCLEQNEMIITPIDPPNNGGGSGGEGSGGTTTQCTTPSIPTNPQPGFTDENGCPIAIPTQPYVVKSFNLIVRALPAEVKALLTSNTQFYNGLQTYYNANPTQQGENFVQWAAQFSWENQNVNWAEFQPMLTFAHNFLQENPDTLNPEAIFLRFKSLSDALLQNPNKLLKIPCNQLPHWQDIAMHQIPQSVKIKLQNIPNQNSYWSSWNITNLDNGEGAHINMDLFPVKISTMPKKPNSTQKYTPAEFFDFFRKNINLFAEKFTPIENNYL
ncbi:Uncharacterised protein [Chryseobacterium taihuense]|uniref:Lipoprotein n=2 Tax=Chryseobacterium group TaxID=2782232 RepID=A0A4U8WIM0_9FLAO|nr:Uncharacterised protein [Chryseobacterium taihuense]